DARGWPREPSRNAQQRGLAGTVPSGERHAFSRGNLQGDTAQRIKSAVPLINAFEADSCGRKTRWRHGTTSETGRSLLVFNAQPRTRSRNTFSARPRSCAYSSSEIVPA